MKRLIFGLLVLVAFSSAKVIKSDAIVFPDDEFESQHKPLVDQEDSLTKDRLYFSEPQFKGPAYVMPLSLNAEPLDFNIIQQRYKQLRHNIVKRRAGFKSKGSSKSKGSGSGYFSSKAKGGNKGQDHNSGYNSNGYNNNKHQQQQQHHASAPQQPAYNPSYGHPAPPPSYGHASPTYGGHPAPAYGQPAYGQPAYHPAPAYHPPAPQQPTVVVVHGAGGSGGGGGGYAPSKGPGLGTALATGLASGVGSGVGFGVANAAINGITGGGNRHPAYPESRPAPPPQNNDNSGGNSNNNNNNNNNQNNNDNFNAQANPECLKTCYSTEEYAPVCGTDGWEYTNIGKLNCMKTCGKRVEVARYGNCYVPPPPGYGVSPGAPGAVAPAAGAAVAPAAGAAVAPAADAAVPPPPPNSPVDTTAVPVVPVSPLSPVTNDTGLPLSPVASETGLPPGVETSEGRVTRELITGVEPDSTSTVGPQNPTTVSPQYTACLQKCPATSEFNPQCGTDGVEYSNPGRLQCAKNCGRAVEVAVSGICALTTPVGSPTTIRPNNFQ